MFDSNLSNDSSAFLLTIFLICSCLAVNFTIIFLDFLVYSTVNGEMLEWGEFSFYDFKVFALVVLTLLVLTVVTGMILFHNIVTVVFTAIVMTLLFDYILIKFRS